MLAKNVISCRDFKPARSGNLLLTNVLAFRERAQATNKLSEVFVDLHDRTFSSYPTINHVTKDEFDVALVGLQRKGSKGMTLEPSFKNPCVSRATSVSISVRSPKSDV